MIFLLLIEMQEQICIHRLKQFTGNRIPQIFLNPLKQKLPGNWADAEDAEDMGAKDIFQNEQLQLPRNPRSYRLARAIGANLPERTRAG